MQSAGVIAGDPAKQLLLAAADRHQHKRALFGVPRGSTAIGAGFRRQTLMMVGREDLVAGQADTGDNRTRTQTLIDPAIGA